ncbi:hypothetical protein SUGI_0770530 [Cryptomeria japonica]|nr:hypothetical protein SUGI_0770530 [Cryptomeria japonica]
MPPYPFNFSDRLHMETTDSEAEPAALLTPTLRFQQIIIQCGWFLHGWSSYSTCLKTIIRASEWIEMQTISHCLDHSLLLTGGFPKCKLRS